MANGRKHKSWVVASVIALAAAILTHTLLVDPFIGKPDNGDFGRMYGYAGLGDLGTTYEEIYDGFVHRHYKIDHDRLIRVWWGPDWVFGVLIAKLSAAVSILLQNFNTGYFDIRILGGIYSVLFLTALYLILKYNKFSYLSTIIAGVYFVVVFTYTGYIGYFNSFFGEAASIVFIFLVIGTLLNIISKSEPRKIDIAMFFLASSGFLTSKTQHIPLLIFMLVIYFSLYYYYENHRRLIIAFSLLVILLCSSVYFSIGDYTDKNNIYQAVFTGVLVESATPEKDLAELGLDEKFAPLAGTGFHDKGLPFDSMGNEMLTDFYPKASRSKILSFYMKQPGRFWEHIRASAQNAYTFYKIGPSDFERSRYSEGKALNELRFHAIEKSKWLHRNVFIFIGFSLIYLLFIIYCFLKYEQREIRMLTSLLLFLLAAGASQMVLPVLGSGRADFGKHLFMMGLAYDILTGTVLAWLAIRLESWLTKDHSLQGVRAS